MCFRLFQYAVRWYLFGRCSFHTFSYFGWSRTVTSLNVESDVVNRNSQSLMIIPPNKKWRISNEAVSLAHSIISGLWASYACLAYTDLLNDLLLFSNSFALHLVYLSSGYLLQDFLDLVVNERSVRIIELLIHHVIVLLGFAIALVSRNFLGVTIVALLMEINSIFLHSRSLLNLYGIRKTSASFRMIALLNITTFLIFRIFISYYLIYWHVKEIWMYNVVSLHYAAMTFVIIAALLITNHILLYRVLTADAILGKKRARRSRNEKVITAKMVDSYTPVAAICKAEDDDEV